MIVTGDDKKAISRLKDYLATEFEMKDFGRIKYFSGVEVAQWRPGIYPHHRCLIANVQIPPSFKIITLSCILIRFRPTKIVIRGWLDV